MYHDSDYVLHRNDVSFRLLVGLRLRLINPFNKMSATTQNDIAQWHNVVNGEVDQISAENEQMVSIYLERLCDEILAAAKKTLSVLVSRHNFIRLDVSDPLYFFQVPWTLFLTNIHLPKNIGEEKDHFPCDASPAGLDRSPRYRPLDPGHDPQQGAALRGKKKEATRVVTQHISRRSQTFST